MPSPQDQKIDATRETYRELQLAYDFFNEHLFDGELPGAMITLQRHGRSMGYFSSERFVNRQHQIGDEIAMNPVFFATRPIEDTLSTLVHEMCHQLRERMGEKPARRCYHDRAFADKMKSIGLNPSSTGRPGGKELGEKMSHYIVPDGRFIQVCKQFMTMHQGLVWFDRFPAEGGKDYEYASSATVKVAAASGSRAPTEQEGKEQGGAAGADLPHLVDQPIFSATPVESGLTVAGIEPLPSRSQRPEARKTDSSNRLKYSCPGCKVNVWGKPDLNLSCGDCKATFVVL